MTTPDILAAAERYRKHLKAEVANKPKESPYLCKRCLRVHDACGAPKQTDEELLARAYVEERKEQPDSVLLKLVVDWRKALTDFANDPNAFLDNFHDVMTRTEKLMRTEEHP